MSTTLQLPLGPDGIQALLEGFSQPAVLLTLDHRIAAANRAYNRWYGSGRDPLGRHCYEVSHHYPVPCDQAGEQCPLSACLRSGEPQRALHLHHTPAGEEHVDVDMRPLRDAKGAISGFLEVMHHVKFASALPAGEGLVGRSPAFNRMLELVQRTAPAEIPVLLLGESGTGKELVARAVHESSPRANGPFVPLECSGLTESLFESELFGHEKGAFTGAVGRKDGLVEAARGGTLFLDEVGDIPLSMQVKLLRLLESGTFRRVGGVRVQRADFRLVCATHRNLRRMVEEESFREDLYYRISAFPIQLPALRERKGDIPLLVDALLKRIPHAHVERIAPEAMECLERWPWPGNIRELRNVLERATLLADDGILRPAHLGEVGDGCRERPDPAGELLAGNELIPLERLERIYLARAVARFPGDKRELARRLGISERTLYRKLRQLQQGEDTDLR